MQMLDTTKNHNVIYLCASAVIVKANFKLSLSKASRLASVSALACLRRLANAKPTAEKRRSTVPKWLERRGIAELCELIGRASA